MAASGYGELLTAEAHSNYAKVLPFPTIHVLDFRLYSFKMIVTFCMRIGCFLILYSSAFHPGKPYKYGVEQVTQ